MPRAPAPRGDDPFWRTRGRAPRAARRAPRTGGRSGAGRDGTDGTEDALQDVVPVAEHVDRDAAAVLDAVVPARSLRRLGVTLEDPVAELAAQREDAAEEPLVDEAAELDEPRKVEL